jgi:RHS repeat-associated protein
MPAANHIVLCRYHYDPLDRLVGSSPAGLDSVQRFYQKSRLATEIQGQVQRRLLLTDEHLLAQHQQQNGQSACTLLGTDQQRSVLHSVAGTQQLGFAYTPYGFRSLQEDLPGFNGEQPDPVTGHYLLGNGYRAFNPVLMRFNSPDSLSPFGEGGLNGYGYCVGDPVNGVDPTGHTPAFIKTLLRRVGVMSKSSRKPNVTAYSNEVVSAGGETGVKNIKAHKGGIFSYSQGTENTINFIAHGSKELIKGSHRIGSAELNFSAKGFNKLIQGEGIDLGSYDNIHLIACNLGVGDKQSFAQALASLTGRPVMGYAAPVRVSPTPKLLKHMIKTKHSDIRYSSGGRYGYVGEVKVFKVSPHKPGTKEYEAFQYKPVTFYPSGVSN